jgi:epoxide hydrolase-like predicted phosphatase
LNPQWIPILQNLKSEGLKVAVLTNNYFIDRAKTGITTPLNPKYFDEIFESCKIGLRKPDPKVFQYVLDKLRVKPEEAIFVDDIGTNLKSAKSLGITTFQVFFSLIYTVE